MATKLVRLINDKKKSLNTSSGGEFNIAPHSGKRMKDVDSEEIISELQSKVSNLEMLNKRLKENVILELFFNYL
jgi:hypothetical protein